MSPVALTEIRGQPALAADFAEALTWFQRVAWREIGANEGCPRVSPNSPPEGTLLEVSEAGRLQPPPVEEETAQSGRAQERGEEEARVDAPRRL